MPSPFELNYAFRAEASDQAQALDSKDRALASMEADVRLVVDELSKRKSLAFLRYCVDFDVIHSAADWYASNTGAQFWAAMLFFIGRFKTFMLPGTLFEILRFVDQGEQQPKTSLRGLVTPGPVAAAFLQAVERSQTLDQSTLVQSVDAFNELRNQHQKELETFFILRKALLESETYSPQVFGKWNAKFFEGAARIVAGFGGARGKLIINNRVDVWNYTLYHQLVQNQKVTVDQNNPSFIFVTDTQSLHRVDRAVQGQRPGARRPTVVWSSRVASIFSLVAKSVTTVQEAQNLAWNLYQALIDERRALHFARTRLGDNQFDWSTLDRPDDTLLRLVQSFENLQKNLNEAGAGASKLRDFVSKDGIPDLEQLSSQIASIVKTQLDKYHDEAHGEVVSLWNSNTVPEETGPDSGFSYDRRIVFAKEGDRADTFLQYGNELQAIIRSDAPLVELIDVLNDMRADLSADLITGKIKGDDLEERVRIIVHNADRERVVRTVSMNWRRLLYNVDDVTPEMSDNVFDITSIIDFGGKDVAFFRYSSQYVDFSREGSFVIITMRKELLDYLFESYGRLSSLEPTRVASFVKSRLGGSERPSPR